MSKWIISWLKLQIINWVACWFFISLDQTIYFILFGSHSWLKGKSANMGDFVSWICILGCWGAGALTVVWGAEPYIVRNIPDILWSAWGTVLTLGAHIYMQEIWTISPGGFPEFCWREIEYCSNKRLTKLSVQLFTISVSYQLILKCVVLKLDFDMFDSLICSNV